MKKPTQPIGDCPSLELSRKTEGAFTPESVCISKRTIILINRKSRWKDYLKRQESKTSINSPYIRNDWPSIISLRKSIDTPTNINEYVII